MKEDINRKTAKIPFCILYFISASIITFDLVFTYVFLKSNPSAFEASPVNAYLSNKFGLNYFLIMVPIVLLLLFLTSKVVYWIIKKFYPKSLVKGDNYLMIIMILITLPNVMLNEIAVLLLGVEPILKFQSTVIVGLILAGIFITFSEIAEAKAKKQMTS